MENEELEVNIEAMAAELRNPELKLAAAMGVSDTELSAMPVERLFELLRINWGMYYKQVPKKLKAQLGTAVNAFIKAYLLSVDDASTVGTTECPTFMVSAASDFGLKVMVALAHWAAGTHDVDADTRREFRQKVREFELWREANR